MTQATVVFRDGVDGIRGLSILNGMHESGDSVQIAREDQLVVSAVLSTMDWDRPENRRVCVMLSGDLTPSELQDELGRFVERVEDNTPNPLKGLTVRRQKSRMQFADQLLAACTPAGFLDEMTEWGISVAAQFHDDPEDQHITIRLKGMPRESIVTLVGRDGSITINGEMLRPYESPDQVVSILRGIVDTYLEG